MIISYPLSTTEQLQDIKRMARAFLLLPTERSLPGHVVETVVSYVHQAEVLGTYDFASSGVFADILGIFPCQCAIACYVHQREVLRLDLQPYIESGLLQVVKPEGEEYATIVLIHADVNTPHRVLGDGEIETCSIALHRNWAVGMDDRKARNYFSSKYPSIQLVTTPEVVKYWACAADPDPSNIRHALERIENQGGYRISKKHSLFSWWNAWFE